MQTGYGSGLGTIGGMYGGGMSSMYGGYGGGLGTMGGMYGGGMSSMYGGYGGGLGTMGGMYGGGMSSMYGGYGGGLGTMGGMQGGMVEATRMNGGLLMPNAQGGSNLQPVASDQLQHTSVRNHVIDEQPRERRARRRRERMQEMEILEKHRQQKRQFAIHSVVQIAGHVLQILMQVMRSGLELFGVGFGTYYSIKALKALVRAQEQGVKASVVRGTIERASKEVAGRNTFKWKSWLIIAALFTIMEILYSAHQRNRNVSGRRAIARSSRSFLHTDEEKEEEDGAEESEEKRDFETSLTQSDEYSSDDEISVSSASSLRHVSDRRGRNNHSKNGRVFVAVFDYDSPAMEGFFRFKSGDRFIVEDYAENGWCEATPIDRSERLVGNKGLVPGNFLRPLEAETKL